MEKSGPRTRKRSAFVLLFWYLKLTVKQKAKCMKLMANVAHEIELRALESKIEKEV